METYGKTIDEAAAAQATPGTPKPRIEVQLPQYRSHKIVRAAKIVAIDHGSRLDLMPHGVVEVGSEWIENKHAEVGGYYVVYDDSYSSFSPAAAFEAGYMPVERTDVGEMAAAQPVTERELQQKAVAPRVTKAMIDSAIVAEYSTTADKAFAGCPVTDSMRRLTICILVLRNGFTVTGESACVSPENFDADVGHRLARENAYRKIWALEGYALATKLQTS